MDKWELTEDQKAKAMEMLRRKQRAYHLKGEPLSQTDLLKHDIELIDDIIIQNPPRWTPHKLRPPVEKEVEALLKLDLAFRSNHPHSSPIVLVKKKDKNDWRLCCDYRSVNLNSKPQFYPSRSIDEVLFKVAAAFIISSNDMTMSYHQIGLTDRAIPICTFLTHMGAFSYKRLSFGLKNASFSLSMLMDMTLGHIRDHTENYHDDCITFSDTIDAHLEHLEQFFDAVIEANLQMSPKKAQLFQKRIHLLGHYVGQGEISPDLDKVQAIKKMVQPKSRTECVVFWA